MKQPSTFVRAATLLSSLLLGGGCVSYRAGLFDSEKARTPASESVPAPEQKSTADAAPEVFSGSKSPFTPFGFVNRTFEKVPDTTESSPPAVLGGTKAPIRNSTFDLNIPPFGGYPGNK